MKETGIITKADAHGATITLHKRACCSGCGVCKFSKLGTLDFEVPPIEGAAVGEAVTFTIAERPSGEVIKLVLAVYATPLLSLLAGIALGYALFGELAAALLGLGFTALTLAATKLWERRFNLHAEVLTDIKPVETGKDTKEGIIEKGNADGRDDEGVYNEVKGDNKNG